MSEKKFTPGPWKLTDDIPANVYGEYSVDDKEGAHPMVAMTDVNGCPSCSNIFYGPFDNEMKANAALISAAPELLEALEELKTQIQQVDDGDRPYTGFDTELIDHAIAKAYGEES